MIVYPSPPVGRKGCYKLREALGDWDAKLLTVGPYIEGIGFCSYWQHMSSISHDAY